MVLKYTAVNAGKKNFVIGNYYRWTMLEEKDIKDQINEYHKLIEELKAENIPLPDKFVAGILIEKLPESWKDYKNQLKHKQKQLPLADLITHIIMEDTNRKESRAAKASALASQANLIQINTNQKKRYDNKPNHIPGHNKNNHVSRVSNPTFKNNVEDTVMYVVRKVIMHLSADTERRMRILLKLIWLKEMMTLLLRSLLKQTL